MRTDNSQNQQAYRFANESVTRILSWASNYTAHERQQLEAVSQPRIAALRAKQEFLQDARRGLITEIGHTQIRPLQASAMWSRIGNLVVAILLTGAGFRLGQATFQPFNLGTTGDLVCAGLAVACPFATDLFLQHFRARNIVRGLVAMAFVTALVTLVLFAEIRADVLAHQLNHGDVVILDNIEEAPRSTNHENERIYLLLRWALISAAFGFELAAGLAVFEFREARKVINSDLPRRLRKELVKTEKAILKVLVELCELLSQPAAVEAQFWTNFNRGLMDAIDAQSISKRVSVVVLAAMMAGHSVQAESGLHLIGILDLSATELATGAGEKSEFAENVRAISRVLGQTSAGSRITILGITNRSLVNPLVLLSARLPTDTGYFGSRLAAGQRTLSAAWKKQADGLNPAFRETDLLGALEFAADVFARSDFSQKRLACFSDMRHFTAELDLEKPKVIDVQKSLKRVETHGGFASLRDVEVFVFGAGAHGASNGMANWAGLRAFWVEYFRRSGARLRVLSTTREAEALRDVTALPPTKARLP